MVNLFATLVIAGRKTIDEVPKHLRDKVEQRVKEMEKERVR